MHFCRQKLDWEIHIPWPLDESGGGHKGHSRFPIQFPPCKILVTWHCIHTIVSSLPKLYIADMVQLQHIIQTVSFYFTEDHSDHTYAFLCQNFNYIAEATSIFIL
jgi:hypothetical protein